MREYNRKYQLVKKDSTRHYPNRMESKVLRRLMSETGLTESEIRKHKKYRVMLSKAQKLKGSKTYVDRVFRYLLKKVCRKLQLPKEHPSTITLLKEEIRKHCRGHVFHHFRYETSLLAKVKNI